MTDEPTVIANQAHLPGLRMPGEYNVEFDEKTGVTTILDGPSVGVTFTPEASVVDAMRRAVVDGSSINESVETYTETEDDDD